MWWVNKFGSVSGPYTDEQIEKGIQQRTFTRASKISSDRHNWQRLDQTRFMAPSGLSRMAPSQPSEDDVPRSCDQTACSKETVNCVDTEPVLRTEIPRTDKPRRIGLFVGISIAAVALVCVVVGMVAVIANLPEDSRIVPVVWQKTVEDYRNELIHSFEADLANPNSEFRKRIERAHLTVTVQSTRIVRCDVYTLDGSRFAGVNNSNIDKVSMLIRFDWKGVFDTGYSDFRIVYDVHNDRVLKGEIEYTTALINTDDPSFWEGVGYLLGTALFSD